MGVLGSLAPTFDPYDISNKRLDDGIGTVNELLTGKKAITTKEKGEVVMLWKDICKIFDEEEYREERLRRWMDPRLESFYPIDYAINLAALAVNCTANKSLSRPTIAEIVLSLFLLTQPSPTTLERSLTSGLDVESTQIVTSIAAW